MRNHYHTWTLILAVVGVAVLAGVGVWWWRSSGYVSTEDARIKAEIVSVSAEITGRIALIAKEEGATVARGEIMARLDHREVELRIRQAQAELDHAQSRLKQAAEEIRLHLERQKGQVAQAEAALRAHRYNLQDAQAHAEQSEEDRQRSKALFEKELIAAQEKDRAKTEHLQAEARVSALQEKIKEGESELELVQIKAQEVSIMQADRQARQADVRRAEAALAELRRQLQLTTIRSPVGGIVVRKNAHQGEMAQSGQPIFMVVDSSRFWVEANVEETEIRHVKIGSPVSIRVDSYPDRYFEGEVIEVGGATVSEFSLFTPQKLTGQFIKSTQRLPVKVSVKNQDGLLKVGMLAVVWIKRHSD
jgi:membrane fusion protein, multidrug efflux system